MLKNYKKLMNDRKTVLARLVDRLFIMLAVGVIVFGYTLVKLKSAASAIIIAASSDVIVILFMTKLEELKIKRFKKKLDSKIKDKLTLERIAFNKIKSIELEGYSKIRDRLYINSKGEKALLLAVYPETILTPKELLENISCDEKEIIASCSFDENCYLLCNRLGIVLRDKKFLLENIQNPIDDSDIQEEIDAEVKEIGEIRKRKKRTSFAKEKWSKYMLTCILLFAASFFMGRFKIIYIAFAGMCMSFGIISLLMSKAEQ